MVHAKDGADVKPEQMRYMDPSFGSTLFISMEEVSGSEPKGENP